MISEEVCFSNADGAIGSLAPLADASAMPAHSSAPGGHASAALAHRFLARQPILNVRRDVVGYELLFRSGWENSFRGERDEATRMTLDNCLLMDLDSLTQDGLAFVNCTREALMGGWLKLLPPQTTVLEIMETVEPDDDLIEVCIDLCKMGYRFALDDFEPRPGMQPLIDIASYIKVDFLLSDAAMRREIRSLLGNSKARLLAEKIEDEETFRIALAEGYEFFQGYFFCRPRVTSNRSIPSNRLNYLHLLVELTREPLDLRDIAAIVQMEPSLCYRLLLLANSPRWSRRTDVTSVQDAFMLVGEDRFRALVSVAASCVISQKQTPALISLSLERARFCELLAPHIQQNPSEQFMLGLMSLLDAMLETSMATIVKSLPLRDEAKAALMGEANSTAVPLGLIRSFESGTWGERAYTASSLGVSEETLARLYIESIEWAADSLAAMR